MLLKKLREEKEFTQGELSRRSGIARPYISTHEKSLKESGMTLKTLKALAKGLDVPPEIFLQPEDCQDCPACVRMGELFHELRKACVACRKQ